MTMITHIDNLAFAKKNDVIEEVLPITHFVRLAQLLGHGQMDAAATAKNTVTYKLLGESKGLAQYYLALEIRAQLTTNCQRCLNPAPVEIDLAFHYLLSDVDAQYVEALDEVDLLNIEPIMDVLLLVEDELIAALPIAPTHTDICTLQNNISGDKPNPFAALKKLLKTN